MYGKIFTCGYEGLTLNVFIARLKSAGVRTIFDVRANPISRKPGFSKTALASVLHEHGLLYAHIPAMGCPKEVRDNYKRDSNWATYTRDFHAYLASQPEAVHELASLATKTAGCLLCFEEDYNRCHRTYVARAVADVAGLRVIHLRDQREIVDFVARPAA